MSHDHDVDPFKLLKAAELWWLELDRFRRMVNDGGWHPNLSTDLDEARAKLATQLWPLLRARRNG